MAKQDLAPFDEIERFVTVEIARIYNRFCETLVVNSETHNGGGRKKKFADLVKQIPNRDHSAVSRLLDHLNAKSSSAFGSKLFVEANASSASEYILLPIGEEFRKYTWDVENRFNEIQNKNNSEGKQLLKIAINTFSFHTLLKVEKKMKDFNRKLKYARKFVNLRSHQIFDAVKHDPTIDAGIVESILPIRTGRQLQVMEISRNKLILASHGNISDEYLNKNGELSIKFLKECNLILGNTENFFDYLIVLNSAIPIGEVSNKTKDIPANMSYDAKKKYIEDQYNVSEFSDSVNLLVDVFLLGGKDSFMLVTPEVKLHIESMNNNKYLGETITERKKKIQYYRIQDYDLHISKWAVRRSDRAEGKISELGKLFWFSCKRINLESNGIT